MAADGVFGAATEAAVRALQDVFLPPSDGIVGPATWQALVVPKFDCPGQPGGQTGSSRSPDLLDRWYGPTRVGADECCVFGYATERIDLPGERTPQRGATTIRVRERSGLESTRETLLVCGAKVGGTMADSSWVIAGGAAAASTVGWPALHTLVFLLRFGSLTVEDSAVSSNMAVASLVFAPMGPIAGVIAAGFWLFSPMGRRRAVWWGYLAAVPVAFVGSMISGLLFSGVVGPILYGVPPLALGAFVGFLSSRRRAKRPSDNV